MLFRCSDDNETYVAQFNIVALETKPGTLLRLSAEPSVADFERALAQRDVTATCAQLTSLIASHRSVAQAPLPLLANHVEATLLRVQAEEDAGSASCFVVECLAMLPSLICTAVANKVRYTFANTCNLNYGKCLLILIAVSGFSGASRSRGWNDEVEDSSARSCHVITTNQQTAASRLRARRQRVDQPLPATSRATEELSRTCCSRTTDAQRRNCSSRLIECCVCFAF